MARLVAFGLLLTLPGCAAIFDGTSQDIIVNTNPPGASCDITRKGMTVASIASTPASATVRKTKDDITITCHKDGYEVASFINHSGVAGATVADIIGGVVTGGVAWAVDSGTGADNKYDSPVNMTMTHTMPSAAPVVQPTSATFRR